MNKQTQKNPGLVVFLLLRAPVGAADVSVSRVVITVKPNMYNVQQTWEKDEQGNGRKVGFSRRPLLSIKFFCRKVA